ncbi:MAG: methionyl-tRNA formyltransferase [Oscillospiraceae bacterium]|nr:methionyl-tRNA formyltransferase [Oscillospiraceae bacterium]
MKIVFMGTPDFASESLKALLSCPKHQVIGVISQPDRPVGRHQVLQPTATKQVAQEAGIPVWQPERIKAEENLELLASLSPDVIVVAAYGQILPKSILELPKYGCVNVHGSLLPAYRGAAPIQRALLEGNQTTGITTMQMDVGMDTGDILLQREIPITKEDTSGSLFEKLAALGGELLLETLDELEKGNITPKKQDESLATYAPMLKKEEGLLDFSRTAKELDCQIRAMDPWPGAYTFLSGKRIKILEAVLSDETGETGLLLPQKEAVVCCKEGALRILKLQPEGKKPQTGEEFMRGLRSDGPVFFGN